MADKTQPLPDGTVLMYAMEDSGGDLPEQGLILIPGEPVIVGTDVNGTFAARLVEEGVCRIVKPETDDTEPEHDDPNASGQHEKPASDKAENVIALGGPVAQPTPFGAKPVPNWQPVKANDTADS